MAQPSNPSSALPKALEIARRDLLDLGLRNPLLNYRLLRARGLEVVYEEPAEVFKILVRDEKRMTFLPGSAPGPASASALPQPEAPSAEDRLTDLRLQTSYTSVQLQSRLFATWHAARTSMEEQGVNTLYLALGMLRWTEAGSDKICRAPLILVPAELQRNDARDRFRLAYTGEETGDNVSLVEKLKSEFGFKSFPELPEPDDIDVRAYFKQVAELVSGRPEWSVESNAIALGFFSFAKFLMYRDLDAGTWKDSNALLGHDLLQRLLGESGFSSAGSRYTEQQLLDEQLRDRPLVQVVDADSSQTIATLDALDGHSMVVQGPPGTGKSQTIVNLIAAAIAAGKKVLFVSEKMAALEVVKRRLDHVRAGDACLELHSNRTNKKNVIGELKRTVARGRLSAPQLDKDLGLLASAREKLNEYCKAVNEPIGSSGENPCSAYGRLLSAQQALHGFDLPLVKLEAAQWSAGDTSARREAAVNLQDRLSRCGAPAEHPFAGSNLKVLLPADRDEAIASIKTALQQTAGLRRAGADLASVCGAAAPADVPSAVFLAESMKFALTAPNLDGLDPANPEWSTRGADIRRVIGPGKEAQTLRRKFETILRPEAWDRDIAALRLAVSELGGRWWRFLSGRWRRAQRDLIGLFAGEPPHDQTIVLAALDAITTVAVSTKFNREIGPYMSTLFGAHWRESESDWDILERQTTWIGEAQRRVQSGSLDRWCLRSEMKTLDRSRAAPAADELGACITRFDAAATAWIRRFDYDEPKTAAVVAKQSFDALEQRWRLQLASVERLQSLIGFNQAAAECRKLGLEALTKAAYEWQPAAQHLVSLFERTRLSALLDRAFRERPALISFDGAAQDRTVAEFRRLDVLQLEYSRALVASRHAQSVPSGGGSGELGLLWREFEKKIRHLPIRRLMQGAGHAIQSIKPVFMMSPLSIANYIPPGSLGFDLVIFDEASQVRPVDALGAIVRGAQIVVVGDSKQLPPTSFFDSLVSPEAEQAEEEDEPATSDIESILGLFVSRGAHQRMLTWHYRSRHESLINVSNHLFYEDRLVVFPSPSRDRRNLGLIYRRIENAPYDRSRTRTNPEEAMAVAAAVMAHARTQLQVPREQRETLGVAAFSVAQMDAILTQLEFFRRQDSSCEEFFSYPPHEPFFVKNLENVQGDERDVILISIGYGRSADGYLAMSFGPLNRTGGERRLNVLISRARKRCEVFTTLGADDIDVNRTSSLGVAALKTFLQYAQSGRMEASARSDRAPDSDFEERVAEQLTALGFEVHTQVGCAGFFLDLAVVDAAQPGRYLLGVECDGARYHSARSARDRDRLRQTVLEGLGWRIYRIWSTDWFHNPEQELRKLVQAIETARSAPVQQPVVPPPPGPRPDPSIERPDPEPPVFSVPPYQTATVRVHLGNQELHELDRGELAGLLAEVVKVESPVHWKEAARRVMASAGVQKMGSRIEAAFAEAIQLGSGKGVTVREEFLWSTGMTEPPVRDRSHLPAASRKLEFVAPEEIRRAVLMTIEQAYGMPPGEVASAVSRMLGFSRLTDEIREAIEPQRDALVVERRLQSNGVNLTVVQQDSPTIHQEKPAPR